VYKGFYSIVRHYSKMSEKEKTFDDPLARYVSDPSAFRKALDEANAIVEGFWILSAFIGGDEACLERLKDKTLRIIVPRGNSWTSISNILEDNDYKLRSDARAPPYGGEILFVRKNDDNLSLKFGPDLDWNNHNSMQFNVMLKAMSNEFGCFMTSKYGVLVCDLRPPSAKQGYIEELRKAMVARCEKSRQGSAKERYLKHENAMYSVMEFDDLKTDSNSFNGFLSNSNILSDLSKMHQSLKGN
jgi:hypothetical protein